MYSKVIYADNLIFNTYISTCLVKLYQLKSTSLRYLLHFIAKNLNCQYSVAKKLYLPCASISQYLSLEPYWPRREIRLMPPVNTGDGICRPAFMYHMFQSCGYSTFQQRKHLFKLMDNKIYIILCPKLVFI